MEDHDQEISTSAATTGVQPEARNDQRYLLAAAGMAFLCAIGMCLIRGCGDSLVMVPLTAGAGLVGAMGGISQSNGKP
jgi:hypothetical protein